MCEQKKYKRRSRSLLLLKEPAAENDTAAARLAAAAPALKEREGRGMGGSRFHPPEHHSVSASSSLFSP